MGSTPIGLPSSPAIFGTDEACAAGIAWVPWPLGRTENLGRTWTGPDGPSDYIPIAPAGSPVGTYLSYAYTTAGSPATIMAPPEAGQYEVRYASDRVNITFKRIAITVK